MGKHFIVLGSILALTIFSVVAQDTIYYTNGNISIIKEDWLAGRRRVNLYDQSGNKTYWFEEVNLSYRHIAELKQRKNGSISKALLSSHPGGGINWTESVLRFDDQNYPISMEVNYFPMQLSNPKTYYTWSVQSKRWMKEGEQKPLPTK